MGWEEDRSQDSLAPKLIFQDHQSGYESKGEVNQFSQGRPPTAADPTKKPDHTLISTSAAELLEQESGGTRLRAKQAQGPSPWDGLHGQLSISRPRRRGPGLQQQQRCPPQRWSGRRGWGCHHGHGAWAHIVLERHGWTALHPGMDEGNTRGFTALAFQEDLGKHPAL